MVCWCCAGAGPMHSPPSQLAVAASGSDDTLVPISAPPPPPHSTFDPLRRISPTNELCESSTLAYVVLIVSIILEAVTATFNVLYILFSPSSDIPYIEFVATAYPRIILFLSCSYLTNKRKFWQQYLKVDHPFGGYITSCIAYVFFIYAAKPSGAPTAFQGWRLHAALLFPVVYFTLVGNLRAMCKWFPWTRRTMYLYKLVRIYHLIFFTFAQVLGQFTHSTIEGTTIAYFGTMLYLLRELLGHVVRREAALMPLFREQRARWREREMGPPPVTPPSIPSQLSTVQPAVSAQPLPPPAASQSPAVGERAPLLPKRE